MPKPKVQHSDKAPIEAKFKERFGELYRGSGLTREEMAEALSVGGTSIYNWVSFGSPLPAGDALFRISKHFDVSVDWLLGRSDVQTTNPNVCNSAEYTGLSEKVIDSLHRQKDFEDLCNLLYSPERRNRPRAILPDVNAMLEDDHFSNVVSLIGVLKEATAQVEQAMKEYDTMDVSQMTFEDLQDFIKTMDESHETMLLERFKVSEAFDSLVNSLTNYTSVKSSFVTRKITIPKSAFLRNREVSKEDQEEG